MEDDFGTIEAKCATDDSAAELVEVEYDPVTGGLISKTR